MNNQQTMALVRAYIFAQIHMLYRENKRNFILIGYKEKIELINLYIQLLKMKKQEEE